MKGKIYLAVGVIMFLFAACNEGQYLTRGNEAFNNLSYKRAVTYLEKALKERDDPETRLKLAYCYRMLNDYEKSENYYKSIGSEKNMNHIDWFHLAKILMNNKKYDEAQTWLKRYIEVNPQDVSAVALCQACERQSQFYKDTTLHTLIPIEFPGIENAFCPSLYEKGIIFTADYKPLGFEKRNPWTGNSYFDVFYSEKISDGVWTSPGILNGVLNSNYHDGPGVYCPKKQSIYFTRSNQKGNKLLPNSNREVNLKLFKASLKDRDWADLKAVPYNSDNYSVGHPSVTADGKRIYFISDMPGGIGGTDIYVSQIIDDSMMVPVNLGATINTPGNEMFPFIFSDTVLYFSSDSREGMGGLDIYVSTDKSGRWTDPENLGYPINSSKDDFAYFLMDKGEKGFISSNRKGKDKIFELKINPPTFYLTGTVLNKDSKDPIAEVAVELIGKTGKVIKDTVILTDIEGNFKLKLNPETSYKLHVTKDQYFAANAEISTVGKKYSENFSIDFALQEIIIEKPIVMQNIYYDLNKAEIRPEAASELDKLVKILEENPSINIELSSHTDSRASDQYNLLLSTKRAQSAVDYIIVQGIPSQRITAKGYGETKLINRCENGVECMEDEHQQNRRTEFKVVKINTDLQVSNEK